MNVNEVFKRIGALSKRALIDEVSATPKPGLVDRRNCGSHIDMNIDTFVKSADVLEKYYAAFAEYGYKTAEMTEQESLYGARRIGLDAESAMYRATDGVNTHKGMIFSGGLVCMATGRLIAKHESVNVDSICCVVSKITSGICKNDYSMQKNETDMTSGERIYKAYGIKGSRGEAESGFVTVREVSYPFFVECLEKYSLNESLVRTLLKLMNVVEDTNIIKRGNTSLGEYVRQKSGSLLYESMEEIEKFDDELIKLNLSPGGSADLLAVTRLLYNIEKEYK